MNQRQITIPMLEFGEVKFEPAVLLLRTGLKPTERHRANIIRRDDFVRGWKILRAGSEEVSSFGPLVQSFRPRPPRLPKNSAKRLVCESEMESRK